jgi:hypothetical protein
MIYNSAIAKLILFSGEIIMTNSSITVTTKSELESARKKKYEEIIVTGKLANDLKKSKRIAYASAATLAIVTAAIIAIPFTGGLSAVGAVGAIALESAAVTAGFTAATAGATAATATAVGLTGIEISTIIVAASLGITLILAVYKEYEEISYSDGTLTLRKKQ